MFTRMVECRVKPDKRDEFNNKLRNDVLPILQKQPGFVDLIGLTSESDAERVISVSFWKNKEDAERGLAAGLITQEQYRGILEALGSDLSRVENQKKLWYTPLGGEIFLHGHANGRTGTAGCVALENGDMDELYAILPVGTPVEIQP